jgi:hypothetical protein
LKFGRKWHTAKKLHPVWDASLQDAEARRAIPVSTDRCIPPGCSEAKSGTLYDNHIILMRLLCKINNKFGFFKIKH